MRDREEAGEGEGRPDLAGDTAEAALDTEPGEAGCCWLPGLVCCRRGSLVSAAACCLVLLLLMSLSMCSCSRARVSSFFWQSSCRISCWVSGLVTLNLRNCCRIRGSSSGAHIFHLSRLLPFAS